MMQLMIINSITGSFYQVYAIYVYGPLYFFVHYKVIARESINIF